MENPRAADPDALATTGYDAVEAALGVLVHARGWSVAQRSGEVRRHLREACPDAGTETALIIAAMSAEVPQRLRAARTDAQLAELVREAATHLSRQTSLDEGLATWAVNAWARALALPTAKAAVPPLRPAGPAPSRRTPPPPVAGPPPIGKPADRTPMREPMRASMPELARGRTQGRTPQPWSRPLLTVAACAIFAAAGYFVRDVPGWFDQPPPGVRGAVQPAPASLPESPSSPPPPSPPPIADTTQTAEAAAPAEPKLASDPSSAAPTPQPSASASTNDAAQTSTTTDAAPVDDAPAQPATTAIERIVVPRVVEGAPFVVDVVVSGRAGDRVSVERRIAGIQGTWARSVATTAPVRLRESGHDRIGVPFRATDAPARAVVTFTAIGRDGLRSAPRTATIVVAALAPSRDMARVAPTGACTATTCGTVVDSRAILTDGQSGVSIYEITVRLDDRRTRNFAARYRLQAGSHVRVVGDRLVPAASASR